MKPVLIKQLSTTEIGGGGSFGFEPWTVDSYTPMLYNLNYQCHILVSFRDRYRETFVAATTALTRSPDRRRTGTPSRWRPGSQTEPSRLARAREIFTADNPSRPRPSDKRLAHWLNRYALGHSERATGVPSRVRFRSQCETRGHTIGRGEGVYVYVPVHRAYTLIYTYVPMCRMYIHTYMHKRRCI